MGADKNFFSNNPALIPNSLSDLATQSCQDHVATVKLLTLGTRSQQRNSNQSNRTQIDQNRDKAASARAGAVRPPLRGG